MGLLQASSGFVASGTGTAVVARGTATSHLDAWCVGASKRVSAVSACVCVSTGCTGLGVWTSGVWVVGECLCVCVSVCVCDWQIVLFCVLASPCECVCGTVSERFGRLPSYVRVRACPCLPKSASPLFVSVWPVWALCGFHPPAFAVKRPCPVYVCVRRRSLWLWMRGWS